MWLFCCFTTVIHLTGISYVYYNVLGTILSIVVSLLWSYFTKSSLYLYTHIYTQSLTAMCLIEIIWSQNNMFLVVFFVFHWLTPPFLPFSRPLCLPSFIGQKDRSCVPSFLILIHLWVKQVLLGHLFVGCLYEGGIKTLFQEQKKFSVCHWVGHKDYLFLTLFLSI